MNMHFVEACPVFTLVFFFFFNIISTTILLALKKRVIFCPKSTFFLNVLYKCLFFMTWIYEGDLKSKIS